jgi:hypothetical protein
MLTQDDQSQSNGSDHDTRGTNQENHKPQKPSCQCAKIHKKGYKRHDTQKLVFFIIYSLTFATLATATLITQSYFLLPVISTMAMGLVGALYHIIGAPLPRLPSSPLDSENKDDHNT